LVASTVSVAIGQRLVRKICVECPEETELTASAREALSHLKLVQPFEEGERVKKGKGCGKCNNTGYRGRVCINEVLVADEEIREAILKKCSAAELKKIAVKNGMTTMLEDGISKVRNGLTTIEEVLRVVHE
jgi:type II secretory ATPase GspE/PulE/Tfp pilus assembly ATPase PilB-like protein